MIFHKVTISFSLKVVRFCDLVPQVLNSAYLKKKIFFVNT